MEKPKGWKLPVLILLAGLSALLLASCGAAEKAYHDAAMMFEYGYDAEEGAPADVHNYSQRGAEFGRAGEVAGASEIRYVILNGSMQLIVEDTRQTARLITNIATTAGGIVSNSNIYEVRDERYAARLTLRVPAKQFDKVMGQLQELGKANNVNHDEADVTAQYVDMEARIKSLTAQEERLREILGMAETVEEVLAVENELARYREEIEVMTTQFTRLQDQVRYSTIDVTVNEEVITTQKVSPAPFENLGDRMKETFVRSINFILTAVAGLLVFLTAVLPVLIVLGLIAAILWLVITRAVRRKPPAA